MVLSLVLDQYEFMRYDFGRAVTFRLYTEDKETPFDASGYTGVLKSFKRAGDRAFFFRDIERALSVIGQVAQIITDITVSWTTQTDGVGTFSYTESARPTVPGYLWLEIQLTKSGEQTSTELVRVYIHPSEAQ